MRFPVVIAFGDLKSPDCYPSRTGRRPLGLLLAVCISLQFVASAIAAEAKPVSYYHDVVPLLKRSCTGCHHPGKLKAELDLTTYLTFKKGGKHGAGFVPGNLKESRILEQITGPDPSMPKEGDALTPPEVALFERWIQEGAHDDTPPEALNPYHLAKPPEYLAPPVISSMAYAPDGSLLAVSGYHEVLLHQPDGSGIVARLVGEAPRIETVTFSPDGKLLGVCGGAPARFGEVQIWNVETHQQLKSFKIANDSVYGISFSPDAKKIGIGCADKTVRILSAEDGRELVKFDNHSDWVFATTFTLDGTRLLSGSRDKAMKLISVANGQFIDDINKLLEGVLCFARHPKMDLVAYGGDQGTARIYKIAENQGRTAANNDVNLVKEFERQPGPIQAIAYSPDGKLIAVGSPFSEVRVYKTADASRAATLPGHEGAVFAIAFRPGTDEIITGGFEGKVRRFDLKDGKLLKEFVPVPIQNGGKIAAQEN